MIFYLCTSFSLPLPLLASLSLSSIHLETSSVLIRQLPVQFLKTPVNWKYAPLTPDTPVGPNQFLQVPEGDVTLGKPDDFPTYGWDNEYGTRTMKYVSNGLFDKFQLFVFISECQRLKPQSI